MPLQRIGLEAGRVHPVTLQGRSTRDALVQAALVEIDQSGYLEARVEAITARARVGYGTFYKYFAGKRDLLRATMIEVFADIFDADAECQDRTNFSADGVRRSVLVRLKAFYRHRRTLRILGSAIGVDPELATLFHDLQREQVDAFARALEESGYHSGPLCARVVSLAVNSLVDETARRWVGGDNAAYAFSSVDVDQLVEILVPMITAAVGPGASSLEGVHRCTTERDATATIPTSRLRST